ncbi:MAG: outer membrane beta-barrel protein [Gammaproteobacteria bacterium]|nr:MAG: outer membrane beta-barrel protein [Gammaproteobacteria bacterium]
MTIHKLLLAMAAAVAPLTALADIGWYAGVGAGGTRLEEDLDVTFSAADCDAGGSSCTTLASQRLDKFEGTDLGFRVFGGLRVGRFFGIEAGYVDLGEPEDEVSLNVPAYGVAPETDIQLVMTDEIDGWEVYGLAGFPLTDTWEVFGKLGVISWDSDFRFKNSFSENFPPTPGVIPTVEPQTSAVSDDGTDLAGGIGFNYQATEHMILRGEGTWYDIENVEQAWLLGFSVILSY